MEDLDEKKKRQEEIKAERERKGEIGRQFVLNEGKMTSKHMSDSFIKNIETTFEKWKPKQKYTKQLISAAFEIKSLN